MNTQLMGMVKVIYLQIMLIDRAQAVVDFLDYQLALMDCPLVRVAVEDFPLVLAAEVDSPDFP